MAEGVWETAAFIGLFGDPFLRNTPYEAGGSPQALIGTLEAFAQVLHPQSAFVPSVDGQSDPLAFVLSGAQETFLQEQLLPQLQSCKEWTERGLKVSDAKQLQTFLSEWKATLHALAVGQPMLVPGGFISNIASHTILYIIERVDDATYSFTVCNKGPGADMYHPQTVSTRVAPSSETPATVTSACDKIRVQSCVQIRGIPAARFLDMAFWSLLFSLWVRKPPSEYHRVETLYDVLLPWLASDKLLPLAFDDAAATAPASTQAALATVHTPQRSNIGFCKSTVEAMRYLCLRSGAFTPDEIHYALLYKLRYRLYQRTVLDLEHVDDPSKALAPSVLDSALQTLSSIALVDSLQGSHSIASVPADAVVGIYFARVTCAPCRKFTKVLTALTESLCASGRNLVIILVSVDQEQADYAALVGDLPAANWRIVPFAEVNARKQLAQTFRVSAVPTLVLRGVDGTILTTRGRELVHADPTGQFFPWTKSTGFTLPKAALPLSAQYVIAMATKQIGHKTLVMHEKRNVSRAGLTHVNALMARTEALVQQIKAAHAEAPATTALTQAAFKAELPFVAHANAGLLQLANKDDMYGGSTAEAHAPTLGNFLDVPERVTSIPLAVAAFVRCRNLCESLLTRAAEGSSSSRISLHHEVIQLVTSLFVEVLPVPEPSPDAGAATTCMWRQPVAKEMQLRCLQAIHQALMTLGCVWQSMEQPSRHFDSERSLAALCALSMFDALLRTPASDEPLELSLLMEHDGGYVLAHQFCKANVSLAKMTSLMEFARPNFCIARGRVLAYFAKQDTLSKFQVFQYHMPEDKIELKKYSTTLIFFRALMEKFNYQLMNPDDPTPRTEMEALMEWFCSEDTPMARDHAEVALTRDLVMVVKFLATMETKEIELMRRRVAHQHWQMWQLSFDDATSSHRRNFFGMRGLTRMLNAALTWEVANFRGSDQDIADVDVVGFMERKVYFGEGPVISSPADLSALILSAAKGSASAQSLPSPITEDDIMHLNDLPTFHGTLSPEESEYLLSYLTVPYARIPLVAAFFASRDRVTYLFNPMLQQLLRAVLFESGDWVSDAAQDDVTHVPLRKSTLLLHEEAIARVLDARVQHQKCADHLGTMNGLLLNELVHAPDAIVAPLLKMLDAIKELGEASVHSADAKFILFMIKLAVDVLRYVTFALDASVASAASGTCTRLESFRERLVDYVFGFAHTTLHKWRAEAEAANNLQTACVIHSYLVLLHISLRASEYSAERVASMIGSIAYVRNWHCFGMKLSAENADESTGLSAEERLLRWLQAQGINTENVSKSSLDKYLKGRPLYLKIGMQTIQAPSIVALRDGDGNELQLPPGEVLEEDIFETIQIHRRGVVRWLTSLDKPVRHGVLSSIVRIALRSTDADETHEWRDASDVASAGRFVCAKTELKLDTQTGEILWRNDELKPVPDSMTQYSDFKAIFGSKSLHCGLVARQEHRLWVNIIGTDFELVEWDDPTDALDQGVGAPVLYVRGAETQASDDAASDELKMYWECPACTCANFNGDNPRAVCDVCATPRIPRAPAPPQQESKQSDGPTVDGYTYLGKTFSRAFDPYSEDDHPHADEQWCADVVGNVLRLQYPPDPEDKKLPFTFFLPADPLPASATRVQLIGHDQGPKDKRDKEKMATFKEIVAYREHQVVHIYSLVTHGRRMYRKLIFTSSSRIALHGFPLNISPDDGPKDPLLLRAAGDPRERQVNGGTLVVLRRNLALNGTEQFVPPRLLQGVVPSCLLEAFRFWLGHDNKLRGEPVDVKSQWFRYRVEVAIANDATAVVTRKSIKTSFSRISHRRDGSGFASGHSLLPPPAPVAAVTPSVSRSAAAKPAASAAIEIQDEDVVQLMAMGFSYAACGIALRENHNDVGMAAQWLLDDANQSKIAQAESAAESGDVLMTEADIHEQNMALLMSLATTPSRIAVEYALEIFANDVELAKAWLSDATNDDEIRRVEDASAATASCDDALPTPMDVDDDNESKRNDGNADEDDETMEVVEEACGETLYLLNALEANGRTAPDLVALAKLLVRVEDLSHVLIWSTTQSDAVSTNSSSATLASIAFIELPRLKLKLKPRRETPESIRLDVLDQSGWSVSDLTFGARSGTVSKHLEAIIALTPDCLVLESDTHDLKLVCPNHDVYRPAVLGEPFSTLLVTDRASVGWQQAMETRFYSYPIHSSHTFVLPPSLSSTLYLILTSLLARNYAAAMELIVGCNVDVTFTEEEKWIFEQLARTLDDRHPNACACRIRLSLGVAYSDNKVPWKLKPELHDYLITASHVDASCRLTLEEETEALANCHQRSPLLSLRKAYCEHVHDAKTAAFEFKLTRSRVGGQPWMRLGLLGKDYMAAHGKKLSTVRYNRPKHATGIDNSFLIDDNETAKLVWNCAVVGDEVSGSNRGLGFLFLYECLNRQLVLRLGDDDCTQSFGDLSARFLHLKLSRWGRETVEDGEEENVPSYPLAQLALLIAHPHERWSASPCDYESTQLLSRGANLYSKVTYGTVLKLFFDNSVDEFQAKLQTPVHQDTVVQPLKRQFSRVHKSSECVVRVAPASTASAREFGPSNTSCDARTFSTATTDAINPELPLAAMDVTKFVTFCDPESHVTATLPFDLSQHPAAQTAAARDLLKRLSDDIGINAKSVNESKDAYITGVTPMDKAVASDAAAQSLHELIASCEALWRQDRTVIEREIVAIERIVNETATPTTEHEHAAIHRFVMERRIGVYPRVTFDFVTSLLASTAFETDLRKRNPFIERIPDDLVERVLAVLFLCNRIVHINRTIQSARALLSQLTAPVPTLLTDVSNRLKQTLQASKDLADLLLSKRHYLQRSDASTTAILWTFDPRFLVFEYVFDLLLRGRQVQMIDAFVASLARGDSRVQQMIMGAGKTTVVGPLLTYILADKQYLVTHVMPTALLEQSRQVLRSRFSNLVLRKRIFTFEFDRSVADDPATAIKLFVKLNRARQHGDVVCASPESIKSMMLKLVELLHSLEESTDVMELPVSATSQNIRRIRRILEDRSEMADELYRVIRLWQQGVLIMDEVDVLLHPLRSELNFPIGNKFPIDLAANRWELPIHLIDAVLATPTDASALSETAALVQQLHAVLADGYATHSLQKFPHLVLLDMEFYETRMLPILTQLALAWLLKHFRMGKMDVDVPTLTHYLTCARAELQSNARLRATVESGLSDLSIKLLNLARDWLRTILPHVLSKINRVSYGLLRGEHATSSSSGGGNSHSRLLLAVPFIGKDVPSRSSEFAHPDVLIGLTILAYRYEGIRVSDLVRIVSQLKQDFSRQLGPRDQRPACALFREWVTSGLAASIQAGTTSALTGAGVLPLPLFQLRDAAQVARLHFLVAKLAGAVYYYVRQHVFPSCMNFQKLKISACGHELGSNALFAKRIGFSGTPSNLLPMDLGVCFYEPRSDGSIFQALTSARIVSVERKVNWSAKSLLLDIARASPPYHALIDTGALITGFENQEVAAFLLAHLPLTMEGVVYLDSDDRQMILLRDHNAPMPLIQCGLHPSKRFTFYDQVHTTGMDIKQCVNACAVVTLGKDMTFRDYAQGAYRMRGIETGQSIHLFLIPEVENRIRHEMLLAQSPALAAMTKDLDAYLLLVPAWLLINSMRMESMQLVQLSLQELHNTWRKRALNALMDEIDASTAESTLTQAAPSVVKRMRRFIGDDKAKQWLRACVNKFRVKISYAVESAVPLKKDLSDVIASLVQANESFLMTPAELARVEDVKQRLAHSSSHHLAEDGSEQGDLRLTAEVVHENEAEAEEEAEEEAEQEEQKMSAFTRDDEHPIPWRASVLAESADALTVNADADNEDGVFYPFAQFQAHNECPAIAFPSNLLVSGNFFRRRWVGLGERRVKNIGLVLEWSPLAQQETMKKIVHHLFVQVMTASPGIAPNEAAVKALSLAAALPSASPSDVSSALKTDVQAVADATPVYLVALSLAEGETIRRMIHKNHPVFQTSQVQLRTCEGELVESSSFAASWSNGVTSDTSTRAKRIAIGIQCLRFFNNEMYFAPSELALLLDGLAEIPLTLRHEFFECCLRLRRRERHLWGDTPLAKVFTKQDEWHLLSARARMQQFQQSLKQKKRSVHLAVALRRFDENDDGRLSAEEILKCLESFQLGYVSAELNEIISLIADVGAFDASGGVPIETICAAFGISKRQMDDVLAKDALKQQTELMGEALATWSCPVCTFANDGSALTCGACSEPNPTTLDDKTASNASHQGWRCGNCTFINQPNDVTCAICELGMDGQREVPRGKWICAGEQGGCTFFNPTSSFYCEVCNRARPDLASTRF